MSTAIQNNADHQVTVSLPQLTDRSDQAPPTNLHWISPWFANAVIVTSLAITAILSAYGVISSGFWIATKATIVLFPSLLLLTHLINFMTQPLSNVDTDSRDPDRLMALDPFTIFYMDVLGPFIEELLFRGILQGVLQVCFESFIINCPVTLLGFTFSGAGIAAILVTSVIFGLVHLRNPGRGAHKQAFNATLGGILQGTLFYQFGFLEAFFAHCLNNSLALSCLYCIPARQENISRNSLPTSAIRV